MAKKLWGGRFEKETDKDFFEFQKSIYYDYKLAEYDIIYSKIHVEALKEVGILDQDEYSSLVKALNEILQEIRGEKLEPSLDVEDVHTQIQNKLEKKVGVAALKLQSFRSRNDQIIFDEKFYCIEESTEIARLIVKLYDSFNKFIEKHKNYYFIGYTHTQRAQIIKFSDYISSYMLMFFRDAQRLVNFAKSTNIYIGSGALAGSNIKREDYNRAIDNFIKKEYSNLKFFKVLLVKNSLDNVSNRDFIIELLNILSILQMHLSRLSEDFILYSTKEFNFLDLPENFCTGSSLMPHKKNPDFFELMRGYTGRIYSNLFSILTTMKGLPLTYNRDMQLDKEPLFSSVDIIKNELKILATLIENIKLNKKAIKKALEDESLYATELAEFIVEKKIPFREAHEIVGKIIKYSEKKDLKIKGMSTRELKTFSPYLNKAVIKKIFNPSYVIKLKRSFSAESVKEAAKTLLDAQKELPSLNNNARI